MSFLILRDTIYRILVYYATIYPNSTKLSIIIYNLVWHHTLKNLWISKGVGLIEETRLSWFGKIGLSFLDPIDSPNLQKLHNISHRNVIHTVTSGETLDRHLFDSMAADW